MLTASELRTAICFTVGDIARLCTVTQRTVSKWFDAGMLKGYRIPNSTHRRVRRTELSTFLKENDMPSIEQLADVMHRNQG